MSFVQRLIDVTIKLASNTQTNQPNTFNGTSSSAVTLSGSRTSVRIENSGAPAGSSAHVKIYGLTPAIMNQLATLGMVFNIVQRNTITIAAGDDQGGLSTAFSGTILAAYANYNAAPDVAFELGCQSGLIDAVASAPASSFTGPTSVETIMSGFAAQMHGPDGRPLTFENSGVATKLSSPCFTGNLLTQMRTCAEHAGINAEIINGTTLAIWPKGGNRNTSNPPLISKDTGMIGYPSYEQQGILLKTIFNPAVVFGGLIQVQSSLKPITDVGTWAVYKIDHALDSLIPHGEWMSTIHAYNPKFPRPVAPQALP